MKTKDDEIDLIEVINDCPPGIEYPDFEQAKLDENVLLVETEDTDPNSWLGCHTFWRGSRWIISLSLSIQNGERALIKITKGDKL
jgi:hypothetical protein